MALIDMITDLTSFDYNKVGKTREKISLKSRYDGSNLPENENPLVSSLENQDITVL